MAAGVGQAIQARIARSRPDLAFIFFDPQCPPAKLPAGFLLILAGQHGVPPGLCENFPRVARSHATATAILNTLAAVAPRQPR